MVDDLFESLGGTGGDDAEDFATAAEPPNAEDELPVAESDSDGAMDLALVDGDGDGAIDLAADMDGDGVIDLAVADVDGEGAADLVVDASGSGGELDAAVHLGNASDFAAARSAEAYDGLSGVHAVAAFPGFDRYNQMCGTPQEDMALWDEQDAPNSCAVAVTNSMFRSIGVDPGEEAIGDIFERYGIYDPANGTDPMRIDDVLNELAVRIGADFKARSMQGFDVDDLRGLLDDGHRPLVAVDPCELYADPSVLLDQLDCLPGGGHAVMVTAVSETADGVFVTLNDPQSPSGAPGTTVTLDRFMASVDDFGNTAVYLTA